MPFSSFIATRAMYSTRVRGPGAPSHYSEPWINMGRQRTHTHFDSPFTRQPNSGRLRLSAPQDMHLAPASSLTPPTVSFGCTPRPGSSRFISGCLLYLFGRAAFSAAQLPEFFVAYALPGILTPIDARDFSRAVDGRPAHITVSIQLVAPYLDLFVAALRARKKLRDRLPDRQSARATGRPEHTPW